jgi:hypothetical protein
MLVAKGILSLGSRSAFIFNWQDAAILTTVSLALALDFLSL